MNHHDIGEPRIRDERSALICMNCGGVGKKTARCSGTSDQRQSWCDACRNQKKKTGAPDQREKDADPAEREWVLQLQHERGRPHDAEHCPLCRTARS